MPSVEREIEGVLAARLTASPAPAAAKDAKPPLSRLEDFAMAHMRSLAFGASGAVAALAAVISLSGPTAPITLTDPVIVGSLQEPPRVPGTPAWRDVARPVELIALQAPQFARQPALYKARRNEAGDREDALVFGAVLPESPEARVALRRPAAPLPLPSLFVDMTRQQAERGVAVARAGAPGRLATKFGDLEVADMTFLEREGRSQSCLAFRSEGASDQPLQLVGWYCAAQAAAAERPELACFIDRLTLLKAGEDKALRTFFADAEQRRLPCPTARISTGRKPTWLDSDGKAPAMRGENWRGDITGSIGKR